jgi:transmembrane sensor
VSSLIQSPDNREERAATWATRLADGAIPPEQEAEFQAWLDSDPANGRMIEEIVGAWAAVEHYSANEAMMELREAAIASARRSANPRSFVAPGWARRLATLAACMIVLIGATIIWSSRPDTYRTGIGERQVVALADGSKISLDANTIVKVKFSRGDRRLWLEQGRAKFDVAKNPLRPFSVQAGEEVVVATGTAFSVEMLRNQVHVVLYEGHVAVLDHEGNSTVPVLTRGTGRVAADRLLTPGRELVIADSTANAGPPRALQIAAIDPVRSLSWEAGELIFNDEPLVSVVERMNRYAAKPLRIGNDAAGRVRISGVFQAGDTEALVQGLAAGFGIRADEGKTAITLVKDAEAGPSA